MTGSDLSIIYGIIYFFELDLSTRLERLWKDWVSPAQVDISGVSFSILGQGLRIFGQYRSILLAQSGEAYRREANRKQAV